MKQSFFIALLTVSTWTAQAQQVEIAPLGAEWHYAYHTSWTGLEGFYSPKCIQDTMLSGKPCKRLRIRISTNAGLDYSNRFIYQKGDSVFQCVQVSFGQYEFPFLFRNNFQLGETTRMGYALSPWDYQVTAIDTLIFNNQMVRRFVLQEVGSAALTSIYDRFGPEKGFFGNWCGIPCDYNYFGLRCYQTPDFPQVNVSGEPCEQIGAVNAKEIVAGSLSLFPNPAYNSLHLVLPERYGEAAQLRIMDMAGYIVSNQSWPSGAFETDVNVTTLAAGAYIIVVQGQKAVFRGKFVKS